MKPVAENVKLAEVELAVLQAWDKNEIFQKTLAKTQSATALYFL